MIFHKRFSFRVLFRIALLLGNVLLIATIFGDPRLFFSQVILAIILVVQVFELIRFVNHTNRELAKFFSSIKHGDFSIVFKSGILGKSFKEFDDNLQEIIHSYKQVKIEKEAQFHFLQLLVNQLHVGIVVLDNSDNITLINPKAEKFIGINGLKNWKLIQTNQPVIYNHLHGIGSNGRKLVEISIDGERHFISLDVRTLIILGGPVKLITFQDINSEIEQKEIEAWHKLIRILTHEIMNSVTPISSLTETMQGMLEKRDGSAKTVDELKDETIGDLLFSLKTIQKRSEGLLVFIDNYRKLTKVPTPVKERIQLQEFLGSIDHLFRTELQRKNISLTIQCPEIEVHVDPVLLEQVLINMITNATHALDGREKPLIELRVSKTPDGVEMIVQDNGKGMSAKELNEIFIPFFTTKKDGTGIGLSLSKQIITMHNGSIRVKSVPDEGTIFIIQLPID